jgi:outer membrane receptor protein involved in Fe transport
MNANLSYNFSNEGISDFTWIDDFISKTSYFNLLKEKRVNISAYLNWTPSSKLRIFGNLSGNYANLKSNMDSNLHNSGVSGSLFGGLQYSFPKDLVLNLNGSGSSPSIRLQGKTMSYFYYSLSASKSFLKKRLTIRLNAMNIFTENLKFTNTTESADFYQKTTAIQPFRQFGLSVSYRFGEMKAQIKKAQRTISNDDQMKGESSSSAGGSTGGVTPQ